MYESAAGTGRTAGAAPASMVLTAAAVNAISGAKVRTAIVGSFLFLVGSADRESYCTRPGGARPVRVRERPVPCGRPRVIRRDDKAFLRPRRKIALEPSLFRGYAPGTREGDLEHRRANTDGIHRG